MEINENLAADSQAAIDAGPHYYAIKSSFKFFRKALKKGMIKKNKGRRDNKKTNHVWHVEVNTEIFVPETIMFVLISAHSFFLYFVM